MGQVPPSIQPVRRGRPIYAHFNDGSHVLVCHEPMPPVPTCFHCGRDREDFARTCPGCGSTQIDRRTK